MRLFRLLNGIYYFAVSTLEGSDIPAQGNALGIPDNKITSPVRAKQTPVERPPVLKFPFDYIPQDHYSCHCQPIPGGISVGMFRPYRAQILLDLLPQGVALGWYIVPLQGTYWHVRCLHPVFSEFSLIQLKFCNRQDRQGLGPCLSVVCLNLKANWNKMREIRYATVMGFTNVIPAPLC